jgi:hypothetical protein
LDESGTLKPDRRFTPSASALLKPLSEITKRVGINCCLEILKRLNKLILTGGDFILAIQLLLQNLGRPPVLLNLRHFLCVEFHLLEFGDSAFAQGLPIKTWDRGGRVRYRYQRVGWSVGQPGRSTWGSCEVLVKRGV